MWRKELGEMYSESWGKNTPPLPTNSRGFKPPVETNDSLRMKGVFGAGGSPANIALVSQASGQNPLEQEEEPQNKFEQWWSNIKQFYNEN